MTMHELKGRHEVCFKAKIGLTGQVQQHALDLPHLVISETEKSHPGFLLT